MPSPLRSRRGAARPLAALALVALAALGVGTAVAAVPADSVLHGFAPVGDYVVLVDGKQVAGDVYRLDQPPTMLVVAAAAGSPVLLSPRTRTVETVPMLKVAKQPDGTVDILADAVLQPAGNFAVAAQGDVSFKVGAKAVVLREKPPLLGAQKLDGMFGYNPAYRRTADEYTPSAPVLERLRKQTQPATVTVYFGSWCPYCKQMVPRMMKVHEQLGAGSKVAIEYYGLPKKMSEDPKTKELSLPGVPTAIVTRGGKEIGRITGDSWKIPELAISNILGSAQGG